MVVYAWWLDKYVLFVVNHSIFNSIQKSSDLGDMSHPNIRITFSDYKKRKLKVVSCLRVLSISLCVGLSCLSLPTVIINSVILVNKFIKNGWLVERDEMIISDACQPYAYTYICSLLARIHQKWMGAWNSSLRIRETSDKRHPTNFSLWKIQWREYVTPICVGAPQHHTHTHIYIYAKRKKMSTGTLPIAPCFAIHAIQRLFYWHFV